MTLCAMLKRVNIASAARPAQALIGHTATASRSHSMSAPVHRPAVAAKSAEKGDFMASIGGAVPQPEKDVKEGERLLKENKMIEPSMANSSPARILALLGAVGISVATSAFAPARLAAFLHFTAYGIWLGTMFFNTFIVGLTMFKNMPRHTFGQVQSKMFPQYFLLTTMCNTVLLGTVLLSPALSAGSLFVHSIQGIDITRVAAVLASSLVGSLANAVWVEPITTALMFKRYKLENKEDKTDADKAEITALFKSFGKWHGVSALLNLGILCVALAHGWHLAGLVAPLLLPA